MSVLTAVRPGHGIPNHLPGLGPLHKFPAPEPGTITIRVMGDLEVDGRAVGGAKPLELVTALCLAGGQMRRDALSRRIYSSAACDSAIPTLCYRARKLGVTVDYEPRRAMYVLGSPVQVDALRILELIEQGDVWSALDLWAGPCLATSDTPLANALRMNLERSLVQAVRAGDDALLVQRAARTVDSLELAEAAMRTGGHAWSTVLAESFVEGTLS